MSLDCESHTQCGEQLGQSSYLWSGRGSNGSVWSRVFHAAVSPVSNTVLKDWINTKDLIGHFEFIRHRIWKQPGSEDWRNWEVFNQGNWKLTRNRNAHFKYLKDYQTRKDMFLFCIHLSAGMWLMSASYLEGIRSMVKRDGSSKRIIRLTRVSCLCIQEPCTGVRHQGFCIKLDHR